MKTKNLLHAAALAAGILSMSISSCEKLDFPEKAPVPCKPEYVPPALVPGTNCQNDCIYVYEGTIDLVAGEWVMNCEARKLEHPNLHVKLDHEHVSNAQGEFLPTLRIQLFTAGVSLDEIEEGIFCRRDAFVRSDDQTAILKFVGYPHTGGVIEEILAVFEEPVEQVSYRILSTRPLPFGEEKKE